MTHVPAAPRYWLPSETAVIEQAAAGEISRADAYAALPRRSREAIDKKIGRAVGGGFTSDAPTALSPDDPGYEDGEFIARRVAAKQASALLLGRMMEVRHVA